MTTRHTPGEQATLIETIVREPYRHEVEALPGGFARVRSRRRRADGTWEPCDPIIHPDDFARFADALETVRPLVREARRAADREHAFRHRRFKDPT